jgi:hypothetical protein
MHVRHATVLASKHTQVADPIISDEFPCTRMRCATVQVHAMHVVGNNNIGNILTLLMQIHRCKQRSCMDLLYGIAADEAGCIIAFTQFGPLCTTLMLRWVRAWEGVLITMGEARTALLRW